MQTAALRVKVPVICGMKKCFLLNYVWRNGKIDCEEAFCSGLFSADLYVVAK